MVPIIETKDLARWYPIREEWSLRRTLGLGDAEYNKAVDDVSISIPKGELVGLAGQSGSGKSTLGELLVRLTKPTQGEIIYDGNILSEMSPAELKDFRRNCQIIFQDPYSSLNPRFTVKRILSEPLIIHDREYDREEQLSTITSVLDEVNLSPPEKFLGQFPNNLSGGERQRVSIARALILDPDFLVADEPVSMLDVSISTGILNLFKELNRRRDLTILYISHDLATMNYLTKKMMVMFEGKIVETGPTSHIIRDPTHHHTKELLEAVPT